MNTKLCPTCKTPIPAHAPGGFCPACILRDADELPPIGRAAPSLVEVSAAFPQLEVLALIGQGGMGFVYKVRQPSLDRTVALKILSPELGREPAFAERFAREARVLGKLNHPNIVTVFESGESGGFFYLIMEHVDGVNLRQAMRAGRFTPAQALAVVPGICDALQAAHAQGVWHRDIKPENILLDAQGGVKIVDFGIARIVGDPQRDFTLTMTGAALGSAAYMAPEQHEKPHDVDHRADIYSLGVVIYEMLTGELPLGRFPAPSERAAVSARIDEIVFQTLEKERNLRQQSAEEVKTDVHRAAKAGTENASPSPITRLPKLVMWSLVLWIGGAVMAAIGALIWKEIRDAKIVGVLLGAAGAMAFVAGFIGSLWALYEMKRGWLPATGRWLLLALTIVPLLAGVMAAGPAYSMEWSFSGGRSLIWMTAFIFPAACAASALLLILARPLSPSTAMSNRLATISIASAVCALVSGALVAKYFDGYWPHAHSLRAGVFRWTGDNRPADADLMAMARKAAGPFADSYTMAVSEDGLHVSALTHEDYEGHGAHVIQLFSRLRDLLPAHMLAGTRADETYRLRSWNDYAPGRLIPSTLVTLAALVAALVGGRRMARLLVGGVALHVILFALPVWPHGDINSKLVSGSPFFEVKDADRPAPDFSTPEKAVMSTYDGACYGQLDVVKRGMSKALVAALDAKNGWGNFMARHRGQRVVAKPHKMDDFYKVLTVEGRFMNRDGNPTSGSHIYVVQEDGEWRLDSLNYEDTNTGIIAITSATWMAKKAADDAAKKVTATPKTVTPKQEAAPAESPEQVFRKLNTLANESNGEEFMKLNVRSRRTNNNPAARWMEPLYGAPELVKVIERKEASKSLLFSLPAKTVLLAGLKKKDGSTKYLTFTFALEDNAWRLDDDGYPAYRAATRFEFRAEKGDALAILRTHIDRSVKVEPVPGAPGQFDLSAESNMANDAAATSRNRTSDLHDSLKKAGLDAGFRIIKEAEVPTKPMHAEEATQPAAPESPKLEAPLNNAQTPLPALNISILPEDRIELDGSPISLDDLAKRLKPHAASEQRGRLSLSIEKDASLEYVVRVDEVMRNSGVKFESDYMDKLLKAATYFISGQVNKPARRFLPVEPITVSMAITLAGGPTPLAALDKVQLHRTDSAGVTKTIIIDVKKALAGKVAPEEDPVVLPGDKINVPESHF